MANRFWVGSGSSTNWDATGNTNWSATSGGANNASVPTTSDDVFFDSNSGSGAAVIAAAANCLNATFTGFTGALTHNAFTWTVIKSLTLSSGMTYTPNLLNANCRITFNDTAAGNTITTAGKAIPTFLINGSGGTWTLQDDITTQNATINQGTFNANNFNCGFNKITIGSAAIVNMGSGTWTMRGLTTSVIISSSCTLNANTSTVVLSNTVNTTKTIAFGGKTLYNLTLNANAGASHIYYFSEDVIVGNDFTITGQNHLQITAGGTITVNGDITITSSASAIVTIDSDSPGTPGNLVGNGAVYNFNYLAITDSAASGGTFNAFNSTDGLGNTGWYIESVVPDNYTNSGLILIATDTSFPSYTTGSGSLNIAAGSKEVSGASTLFLSELNIGDWILDLANYEMRKVVGIGSNTACQISNGFANAFVSAQAQFVTSSRIKRMSAICVAGGGKVNNVTMPTNVMLTLGDDISGVASSGNGSFCDPVFVDGTASPVIVIYQK